MTILKEIPSKYHTNCVCLFNSTKASVVKSTFLAVSVYCCFKYKLIITFDLLQLKTSKVLKKFFLQAKLKKILLGTNLCCCWSDGCGKWGNRIQLNQILKSHIKTKIYLLKTENVIWWWIFGNFTFPFIIISSFLQ